MNRERIAGEMREGMPFLGGRLWIDFLNTRPLIGGTQLDLIADDDSVKRWARLAHIESETADERDRVEDLKDLRDLLARAFDKLTDSKQLPHKISRDINRRIERSGIRFGLVERDGLVALDERTMLVGPPVATAVAWDFARFLGDFDGARLRHCDNPACTLQFYDLGKNNRRRWCTMSICGNRDKVAHYRARHARPQPR